MNFTAVILIMASTVSQYGLRHGESMQEPKLEFFWFPKIQCKFSIDSGCTKKISLNPLLQKGEAFGMRGLIEMFQYDIISRRH